MTITDKIRLAEMWAASVDPPVILAPNESGGVWSLNFENLPNWLSDKMIITLPFNGPVAIAKQEAWLALWDQLRVIILPMKFLLADIVGLEVKQQIRMAFIYQIGEK